MEERKKKKMGALASTFLARSLAPLIDLAATLSCNPLVGFQRLGIKARRGKGWLEKKGSAGFFTGFLGFFASPKDRRPSRRHTRRPRLEKVPISLLSGNPVPFRASHIIFPSFPCPGPRD